MLVCHNLTTLLSLFLQIAVVMCGRYQERLWVCACADTCPVPGLQRAEICPTPSLALLMKPRCDYAVLLLYPQLSRPQLACTQLECHSAVVHSAAIQSLFVKRLHMVQAAMGPGGMQAGDPGLRQDLGLNGNDDLEGYLEHLQRGVNGEIELNEVEQAQLHRLRQAANNREEMAPGEREQWERLVQEHGDEGNA